MTVLVSSFKMRAEPTLYHFQLWKKSMTSVNYWRQPIFLLPKVKLVNTSAKYMIMWVFILWMNNSYTLVESVLGSTIKLNIHRVNFDYLMGPYNAGPNFTPAPLTPALIAPVSKIPFPHLGPALKGPPDIFIEITYLKSCAQREAENNFRLMKK